VVWWHQACVEESKSLEVAEVDDFDANQ